MDSNSLNTFTILGFVGQDAKGYTSKKNSRKFTIIDICTQEKYRNKPKPKKVWHHVQIWGTLMAPWAEKAVKEGMMTVSRGRLDYHYLQCECGKKYETTDLKVEEFIILRGKKYTVTPAPAPETPVQTAPIVEEDPY